MQSQKGFIWGGSIGFVVWLENVRYQEGHICIMRKGYAVQGDKVCDRVLHLVCNVREVCSIRRVTSAVQGQGLRYKLESVEVTPSPHTAHSVYRVILLITGRLGSVVILPQFRTRGFLSMRNVSKSILLNELWPDLNCLNCNEQT